MTAWPVRPGRAAGARRLAGAVLVAVAAAVALVGAAGPARAGPPTSSTPTDQDLLKRFAPVMAIRRQSEECGSGERYRPMTVDHVLGRDDVVLRDGDGDVVVRGPTAEDLAGRGADHYLDFPFDALRPGCDYEKWFRTFDVTPSIYGRVTRDRGQLVAQYWFYWVYNQWNDLHESDWEMIQLHFDTDDLEEAMQSGPSLYAYAQHEGAEYADAGDEKVELLDGTHPVVYASGGSHASYFSSTRWFGKSGATGFGCDDTTGPTDLLTPEVVALPREAPTTGEHAWLSFAGRWGEKEPFFNDGPTGPASKDRWDEPLEWVDENGRATSVALPFARSEATRAFCGLSATGSAIFNRILADPLRVAVIALVLAIAVAFVVRFGSRGLLVRAARTWWTGRHGFWRVGVVAFAGSLLALVAQVVVFELTVLGTAVDILGSSSAWVLPLVGLVAAVVIVPASAWVVAATIALADGDPSPRDALRTSIRERASSTRAAVVVVATVGLTLFVMPLFVLLTAVWLLAPAVAAREGGSARASLRRSRRLLAGRRWRSVALAATLTLVLASAGLVGALVLLITSASFVAAALVVGAANAFLVPYVTLVLAHYHDEVVATAPGADAPAGPDDGPRVATPA